MRTATLRTVVAALAGSLLLIPTAASAGPVCEDVLHSQVEPNAGPAGFVVHEAEAACGLPLVP